MPKLIKLGDIVAYEVESSTDKKKKYVVREMPDDGELRCSCPAFVFRNHCKHADLIRGTYYDREGNPKTTNLRKANEGG
jgi:hypothetical protein